MLRLLMRDESKQMTLSPESGSRTVVSPFLLSTRMNSMAVVEMKETSAVSEHVYNIYQNVQSGRAQHAG
jgi:hypothetical protein